MLPELRYIMLMQIHYLTGKTLHYINAYSYITSLPILYHVHYQNYINRNMFIFINGSTLTKLCYIMLTELHYSYRMPLHW